MSIKAYEINGQTFYEVYVQGKLHGNRFQKRLRGIPTLKAARDLEDKIKAQLYLDNGKPQRVTWEMWFNKFLEQIRVTRMPGTVINYEKNIGKWVNCHWNDLYLDEITPNMVCRLVMETTEGLSLNSKRALLDQLKSFCTKQKPATIDSIQYGHLLFSQECEVERCTH